MSATDIRKEIHEYVENADSRVLGFIYAMILADKAYNIPDWHQPIVEERLSEYEANPLNTIPWDELKEKISSMR